VHIFMYTGVRAKYATFYNLFTDEAEAGIKPFNEKLLSAIYKHVQ